MFDATAVLLAEFRAPRAEAVARRQLSLLLLP
jgi:hypothetical protein